MSDKIKKCPYCGETININAKKCRCCGEWLVDENNDRTMTYKNNPVIKWINYIWIFFGILLILMALAMLADGEVVGGFGVIVILILFYFGTLIYMFPSIIAAEKKHPQFTSILIINLIFGGSVIGWIGALVWANTHRTGRHTHW